MSKANNGSSDQTKSILKPNQKVEHESIQQFPANNGSLHSLDKIRDSTSNKKNNKILKIASTKDIPTTSSISKINSSATNISRFDLLKSFSKGDAKSSNVTQKLNSLAKFSPVNPSNLRDSLSLIRNAISQKTSSYLNFDLHCDCGPNFYNQILGPTADEAFLRGLESFFNVCKKFMVCDKEPVKCLREVQFQPESVKSVPKIVSDILESAGFSPEMVSKILQTSSPDMISEILQVVGLEPELVSGLLEANLVEPPKTSATSVSIQTSETEVTEENFEKSNACACCQCDFLVEDECSCSHEESKILLEPKSASRYQFSNPKVTFEKEEPVTYCRCYDCCAPVVYKPTVTQRENSYSRSRLRSKSSSGRSTNSSFSLARGDTCI